MRKTILIFICLFTIIANAQVKEIRKELFSNRIVQLFESLEAADIKSIEPYLSKDLKVSGYEGQLARSILKSMPFQVTIPSEYKIISVEQEASQYRVKVITAPEEDDYDFLFDAKGQFLQINMFEVQVQEQSRNEIIELDKPLRIPFSFENGIIFIHLKINGRSEPLNFVFDTGATTTVLDSAVAVKYGIKPLTQQNSTGATGNQAYDISTISDLKMGTLDISNISCVLVDLAHLKGKKKIDGIIGYTLLSDYVTKIDYNKNELVFYNTIKDCDEVYKKQIKFDFENEIPIPQIPIAIRLKTGVTFSGKVLMDTGAAPNFILNSNITRDNDLLEKFNPKIEVTSESLTGGAKEYESTLEQLSFDKETFSDAPIIISLATEGVNTFPNLLGILGNGILHKRNWIFDYENQIAYYEDNQFSTKEFEYPCTNFSIQQENGIISFATVQPKSREAKKGIQTGMEILSINGHTDAYDEMKRLLKTPNIKLKIQYKNTLGAKKWIRIKTGRKI